MPLTIEEDGKAASMSGLASPVRWPWLRVSRPHERVRSRRDVLVWCLRAASAIPCSFVVKNPRKSLLHSFVLSVGGSLLAQSDPAGQLSGRDLGSDRANVWAAGAAGTLLHFDGKLWESVESNTDAFLSGLWGSGPSDVWACGNRGPCSTRRSALGLCSERNHGRLKAPLWAKCKIDLGGRYTRSDSALRGPLAESPKRCDRDSVWRLRGMNAWSGSWVTTADCSALMASAFTSSKSGDSARLYRCLGNISGRCLLFTDQSTMPLMSARRKSECSSSHPISGPPWMEAGFSIRAYAYPIEHPPPAVQVHLDDRW